MPIQQDRYESIASEVLAIYDEAESVMMHRVARRLLKGINQPGWTERKYGEVQQVTKEMRDYMRGVSEKRRDVQQEGLTQAYNGGRDAFIDEARKFTNVTGIAGLTANTSKVVRIMAELDRSMNAADRQILRTVNDAYSSIVGKTSALVATGTITYRDAVKRELDSFANRGITSFRDKADRVWDMETYAEMATLTAIERATREGYTDTMQEYGFDLAIISDHYGACPVCEAWQGVVVSVSGNTPGYHSLADAEAAGVFHPRCLHDISTYFDGITKGGRAEPREVQPPNPGYAVRSTQRMYERQIRKWKRRMAVASTPQEEREAYARVRMYQGKIRELVSDYNTDTPSSVDHLPRKYWREGGRVKMSAAARKLPPAPMPKTPEKRPAAAKSAPTGPTIAGVRCGKPMTHDEADKGRVNPNFRMDVGYRINCQSCVPTYEARLRGYDVEVVANDRNHPMCEKLSRDTLLMWKNADGSKAQYEAGTGGDWLNKRYWNGPTPTAKRFEKLLKDTLVDGGRYSLEFKWRGFDAAHIVTIRKENSELVIYDPQSDMMYKGAAVSEYLDRIAYKRDYMRNTFYKWPGVTRLDNKEFNFDVANEVMKRREQK